MELSGLHLEGKAEGQVASRRPSRAWELENPPPGVRLLTFVSDTRAASAELINSEL